jgi:hypothetical protein
LETTLMVIKTEMRRLIAGEISPSADSRAIQRDGTAWRALGRATTWVRMTIDMHQVTLKNADGDVLTGPLGAALTSCVADDAARLYPRRRVTDDALTLALAATDMMGAGILRDVTDAATPRRIALAAQR